MQCERNVTATIDRYKSESHIASRTRRRKPTLRFPRRLGLITTRERHYINCASKSMSDAYKMGKVLAIKVTLLNRS